MLAAELAAQLVGDIERSVQTSCEWFLLFFDVSNSLTVLVDNLSVDQIVLNCTSSGALPQQWNAHKRQQVQIRASWNTEHMHIHMHADTGDGPGAHFSRVPRWLHRKLQP